ncbi:hypothetical protein ABIE78_004229 [Sinorhizobium fredii]|uniref:hypothetical protein n=1 Tax=Rhizobium fredii TaxID=380 RepID=UPI002FCDE5C0
MRGRRSIEAAAFDVGELPLTDGVELGVRNPGKADRLLVADDRRPAAVDDRAHGEFRLPRDADLAHQQEIERSAELARNLHRSGHASAGQGQYDGLLPAVGI